MNCTERVSGGAAGIAETRAETIEACGWSSVAAYRPRAGHAIVRTLPDLTRRLQTDRGAVTLLRPGQAKSVGWYAAHVEAVGAGAPLEAGQTVIVQAQSGHPIERYEDGSQLVLVPCRALPTAPHDAEHSRRLAERARMLKASIGIDRNPAAFPEAVRAPWEQNEAELRRLVTERQRCGRSRVIHATQDPAQAEGVLAVLEVEHG